MRLEKLFKMENVSLDLEANVEGQDTKAKDLFCDKWDEAKGALLLIQAIVKNPIVKLIVLIVISVGDGIKEKVCPK